MAEAQSLIKDEISIEISQYREHCYDNGEWSYKMVDNRK